MSDNYQLILILIFYYGCSLTYYNPDVDIFRYFDRYRFIEFMLLRIKIMLRHYVSREILLLSDTQP